MSESYNRGDFEWVMVPREPTEAMVTNMAASLDYPSTRMGGPSPLMLRNVERAYRAMLAAAPKPESAEASAPVGVEVDANQRTSRA